MKGTLHRLPCPSPEFIHSFTCKVLGHPKDHIPPLKELFISWRMTSDINTNCRYEWQLLPVLPVLSLDPPDCPFGTWISISVLQIRLRDLSSSSNGPWQSQVRTQTCGAPKSPFPLNFTASLSVPWSPVTDQGGGNPDESQGGRGSGRREHQGWALRDRRMKLKQRKRGVGRRVLGGPP